MDALVVLFSLFLLLVSFVLFVGLAFLFYKYISLKHLLERVEQEQAGRFVEETQLILSQQREIAQAEAASQLQQWRQQELDLARQQQTEIARREALAQFEQWKTTYEQSIRQDAIQRSQSVTVGKVTEHFVPYLPDFKYNPKDARFIGSPVDFLVFDGLSDGELRNVVFVEVKTGSSGLSTRERQIRDAVQTGKVSWAELRPCLNLERSTGEMAGKG